MTRVFLLSPAICSGERARLVLRDQASFELSRRLRTPAGAPLGEVFAFLSGLYFRGKLTYARSFGRPPQGVPATFVITPTRGLLLPEQHVTIDVLREFAAVDVRPDDVRYRAPLERDVRWLAAHAPESDVVLLGSIATTKYVDVLLPVLGRRLRFPATFVGRGDMSRGGLLLRAVRASEELDYLTVDGSLRHGPRPARLLPDAGRRRTRLV